MLPDVAIGFPTYAFNWFLLKCQTLLQTGPLTCAAANNCQLWFQNWDPNVCTGCASPHVATTATSWYDLLVDRCLSVVLYPNALRLSSTVCLQYHFTINPVSSQLCKEACVYFSVRDIDLEFTWNSLLWSVFIAFSPPPPPPPPPPVTIPWWRCSLLCVSFLPPRKHAERSASSLGILQDDHFHSRLYKILFL